MVTLDFWPQTGGVANYYFNLCRQLGERAVVLTTQPLKHKSTEILKQVPGFKIVRRSLLVKWIWPHWLSMFWHIWRAAKREKADILWVGEILPSGTVVYYLTKILKLPYIVSCHGNDILQAGKVRRRKKMAQKVLSGAKLVTVNSRYTGRLVEKLEIEDGKIKVVYPGVDSRSKIQDLRIKDDLIKNYKLNGKKVVLSVGRLVERKGFDKVIEAMPQVAAKVPEVVYLIAGSGPDEERLKELSVKASGHIRFLGRISEEEKWELLGLCDVFIMPARENDEDVEGFGIVYLEAGLAGKPVLAGKVGGAKEAVVDRQTGLLVNSENLDEISRAIIELLNDQELADKLGRAGQQRAMEEFSWEKVGGEFREIIDEIE